jgi:hypothetical protein
MKYSVTVFDKHTNDEFVAPQAGKNPDAALSALRAALAADYGLDEEGYDARFYVRRIVPAKPSGAK